MGALLLRAGFPVLFLKHQKLPVQPFLIFFSSLLFIGVGREGPELEGADALTPLKENRVGGKTGNALGAFLSGSSFAGMPAPMNGATRQNKGKRP